MGKSESSKEMMKRWGEEKGKLKIDLREKHDGELAELEKRYNEQRLETIALAYPPPAYE